MFDLHIRFLGNFTGPKSLRINLVNHFASLDDKGLKILPRTCIGSQRLPPSVGVSAPDVELLWREATRSKDSSMRSTVTAIASARIINRCFAYKSKLE